jgi:hypothetical protein
VDLAGSVVNLSTGTSSSSDGNPTMTVQKDCVAVKGDLEFSGAQVRQSCPETLR